MDGTAGGPVAVDTAALDEGAERLGRAVAELRDAGADLDRLPVVAVATGADAVLDALADLGRQWLAGLDQAVEAAHGLVTGLRAASDGYAWAEREAAAATAPLPRASRGTP